MRYVWYMYGICMVYVWWCSIFTNSSYGFLRGYTSAQLGAGLPTPSKGVGCCPGARGIHLSSDVLNMAGKLRIY